MLFSTSVAREEKSVPKLQKTDYLVRANAISDLKLKPMLIYYSPNPRALNNYAKSVLFLL